MNSISRKRTRHTSSKYHDENTSTAIESILEQETHLSEDDLVSIIEASKTKIIKDDLFGHEINYALKAVQCCYPYLQHVLRQTKSRQILGRILWLWENIVLG